MSIRNSLDNFPNDLDINITESPSTSQHQPRQPQQQPRRQAVAGATVRKAVDGQKEGPLDEVVEVDRRTEVSEELFDPKAGELEQFEYNWTIADFYAAMTEPGCTLVALDEIGDESEDWEASNFSGLPQVILLAARKNVP